MSAIPMPTVLILMAVTSAPARLGMKEMDIPAPVNSLD